TFFTNATDNIGVEGVQLFVDEVPVTLTANGVATYTPSKLGTLTAKAVAVDAAGNLGESSIEIRVYDPNDLNPPIVELSPTLGEEPLTDFTDIIGTVMDDNLTNYVLSIAPASGGEFVEIASGNSQISNGKLAGFDPTLLQNDTYILRLTATDESGNTASAEQMVDVAGELKLGNFRLSFTDLEVPVAGIPINLTRTYDTLTTNQSDDFGYGWRLEFRDTDLRTSVGRDELYEQMGIPSVGFEEGTRVYVTLPGGKRTGFTFKPVMDPEIVKALRMGAPLPQSMIFYNPAFETDDGSQVTLSAQKTQLLYNQETGQYYHPSGSPYNPANSFFGGTYTLTTKEGIEYEIDGTTGDLLTVTDTNGNTLTYSDEGIFSSTGKSVTFERNAEGRIVAAVDPEGNKIEYEYDENGDLVGVTDREENTTRFEYHEEREHYLEEIIDPLGRTGVRTEYDESGRLKRMLDVNGEAVELVYDPDNSTQTVLDVFGNPTTYVYDERGNVVTEVDAVGLVTRRTYDEDNNVLTETVVTEESGSEGWTTTYTYDAEGNKLSEIDPLGNVTRWSYNPLGQVLTETKPLGQTTTYEYDSQGNLLSTNTSTGAIKQTYDRFGNITAIIDAEGQKTQFEYDFLGRVTRQIDALGNSTTYTYNANGQTLTETTTLATPNGSRAQVKSWTYDAEGRVTSETDPLGNVTEYEYDKLGNMTALIEKGMNDRRTEYRYDAKGQLETTLYPDGTSVRSVYDAAGREIARIDQKGQTTHFIYDAKGRLIETTYPDNTPNDLSDNPRTQTEYDKMGRTRAFVDERGFRTEYEYDIAGRRILKRDALNNEIKYTYNAAGNRLSETDARNYITQFVYDDLGRPTETHFPDGTRTITTYDTIGRRSSFTDQSGHTTYFVYDALNRPIEVIHPDDTPNDLSNNPRTKTEYNELGWVTAEIDELGNRQEYEYDELGRLIESRSSCACRRQTYTYDAFGNRLSETDPLGNTTFFVYDKLNRLVETHFPDGSYMTTTYDELGRLKTQTDPGGKTTDFEYDALGRLSAVVDALQQRTEYNYDDSGNLIQAKDANQNITQYEYDPLNRRTATILPLGQRSETTYDPVGNIASIIDFNRNTITYEYDSLNRIIAKYFPDTTAVEWTYTPTGQIETIEDQRGVTAYDYDVRERLISRIDPDNQFIRYGYDVAGNRTEVIAPTGTTKYTYDKYNQLETVTDPNLEVTRYTYDKAGNLIRTNLPNHTVETREYDDLNRLVFLENSGHSGVISSYRYTLDPAGNRQRVEENDGRVVEYNYDALYRLTQEKITAPGLSDRMIDYAYDAVGNRLSYHDSIGELKTYTYDPNDRLLSDGSSRYTYDNNGNTLSRIADATDGVVYSWDYENRLVGAQVTKPTGTVGIEYEYNADGIRVATTVNGEETRYLIDANQPHAQVLSEYAPDGTVQANYVYGTDLISQNRDGVRSFYHVDGLGSTRALTNASGVVTDTYDYEAYGNLLSSVSNTVNNYRFAGEQFDPYLGDYYLRMRYYNSDSGRFTTTDPFEGFLSEPLSRAKYPYVHGNPVNAIDPSGLSSSVMEFSAFQTMLNALITQSLPLVTGVGMTAGGLTVLPIAVVAVLARAHVLGQTFPTDVKRWGVPIIIWGGGDLPQTTNHVFKALTGSGYTVDNPSGNLLGSQLIPPLLSRIKPPHSRSWYPNEVQCKGKTGRDGGTPTKVCDEYPYASTAQGGAANYRLGQVSIHPVLETEQSVGIAGIRNTQGLRLNEFYRLAKVGHEGKGDSTSWYVNFAFPWVKTFWVDRGGKPRYF
uniref:RHS repeat-associated core domain-containing protein n=1 Tax=Oscillatoria sp. HE19RPO TaxID=2954806 RepID=UPI00273A70D1